MKVKELIELLQKQDPETVIVLGQEIIVDREMSNNLKIRRGSEAVLDYDIGAVDVIGTNTSRNEIVRILPDTEKGGLLGIDAEGMYIGMFYDGE